MRISIEEVKPLVEKGIAHMEAPPSRIPSDNVVDAPILGNGDIGVAIGGDGASQVFYFGKNDFWAQAHLGQSPARRREILLSREGRRTGTHMKAAGWLQIDIPALAGCSYSADQDLFLAEVRADYAKGDMRARYTSFVCAAQNTLVIELENAGAAAFDVGFCVMPGSRGTNEIYGYGAGVKEDTLWFDYPAEPQMLEGTRWVFANAACDVPSAVYTPEKLVRKSGGFALEPGASARIVMAMLSDLDAPNAVEETHRLCIAAKMNWKRLKEEHRAWWADYWTRSYVQTGSDVLDAHYYASLYIIASATRAGKVPPAIFGPWVTTDHPSWSGAYTLNYNYQSPFFCLYTSNRQHLITSYIDPLLDSIPAGRLFAKEKYGRPGIALPVQLGPWGSLGSTLFHHQKTNAAYCCVNIFMHYFSTLDAEWGKRAYPFVREAADFWEADLVWEEEQNRYSVVGDSLHEEYYREGGEKNNTHALGLVRMVMRGILKMSADFGLDADKRGKWQHILDHLAAFPVFERNGQQVYRYNEDSYAWRENANGSNIKFIYPFNCVGFDSDAETLEIAKNTAEQKSHLFDNGNAFCEYFVMCARVGVDPRTIYDKLIWQCGLRAMPNKYIYHGGGGIEDCSGVTSAVNEMMLQSFEGVIRLFPSWVPGVDASFKNLRGYGAFLVSSSIQNNRVEYIKIESEKGGDLTIVIPWESAKCKINGIDQDAILAGRVTIKTEPGDVIYFFEQ